MIVTTAVDVAFIVSFDFDGVLVLDFLTLDLELILVLELSADLGFVGVLEVTDVLKFTLDLGLSAGLELKFVLCLASELNLFLASLDFVLDLELTSAVASVDGSFTVATVTTVAARLGFVTDGTAFEGLVTLVATLLGEATLIGAVDLVVVVIDSVLVDISGRVTVITALVTLVVGEVAIVDCILVDTSTVTEAGFASKAALLTDVRAVASGSTANRAVTLGTVVLLGVITSVR